MSYQCSRRAECRTYEAHPELCFLNMTKKERTENGGVCPVQWEYTIIEHINPFDLPDGLVRKLLKGEAVRGISL